MANTIHFQLRGDIAANWEGKNPVLLRNEPGFDTTNNRLKMGDGVTAWNDLPFLAPEVVNNLISGGSNNVLSAEQGKILKTLVDNKMDANAISPETWIFTLDDGTTIAKKVGLCSS